MSAGLAESRAMTVEKLSDLPPNGSRRVLELMLYMGGRMPWRNVTSGIAFTLEHNGLVECVLIEIPGKYRHSGKSIKRRYLQLTDAGRKILGNYFQGQTGEEER